MNINTDMDCDMHGHGHGQGLCPDHVVMHVQQLSMFANSTLAKFANLMFADLTFTNSTFAI